MTTRPRFEIGDKVVCITPGNFSNLRKGEIYTITECMPNGLVRVIPPEPNKNKLIDLTNGTLAVFSPTRFKHIPRQSLKELLGEL